MDNNQKIVETAVFIAQESLKLAQATLQSMQLLLSQVKNLTAKETK